MSNNNNNNNNDDDGDDDDDDERSPVPVVEAVAVPHDDDGLGHQASTVGERGELLVVVRLARAGVHSRRHLQACKQQGGVLRQGPRFLERGKLRVG